ncbi:MAG: 16S rRNA (guanine(966)-N(2))-methyltransferase RsmD [Pseudomonadota bacterium]
MRIVAGRFGGLRLSAPKSQSIRPTSDRVRESLFGILQHGLGFACTDRRVLDLFAGTGALGLEALSRGAAHAVFVENGPQGRSLIRDNIERSGTAGATRVFRRDATRLGPVGAIPPFDLCFLDPPYERGLGERALASAAAGGWLAPGAHCVLEEHRRAEFVLPERFDAVDERAMGDTVLRFLVYSSAPL